MAWTRRVFLSLIAVLLPAAWVRSSRARQAADASPAIPRLELSRERWRELLPAEAYAVLFEEKTERAFTSSLLHEKRAGSYLCAACFLPLFRSETKFESHCGWPSFYAPLAEDRVEYVEDRSMGSVRTEVRCANCGSHLGHVFDSDGATLGVVFLEDVLEELVGEIRDESQRLTA